MREGGRWVRDGEVRFGGGTRVCDDEGIRVIEGEVRTSGGHDLLVERYTVLVGVVALVAVDVGDQAVELVGVDAVVDLGVDAAVDLGGRGVAGNDCQTVLE